MNDTPFSYRALNAAGETIEGRLSAPDARTALRRLGSEGLTPLEIKPLRTAAVSGRQRRIKPAECIQLLQELATLLQAGVPLGEALPSLADAYHDTGLAEPLGKMVKAVRGGSALGPALRQGAIPLPRFALAVIDAGEASGQLSAALEDASRQMAFEAQVRQEARNALTYPTVLVVSGIAAILIVFIAVVPRFAGLLKSGRAEVPEISRIVISLGLFAQQNLLLIGLGFAALAGLAAYVASQPVRRQQLRDVLATWPLTRGWILPAEIGRWATLLATLLTNRVPMLEALRLSGELLGVSFLRKHLEDAQREVRQGKALSDILTAQGWLGATQLNLVRVGERSGELPRMLGSLGQLQTDMARQRIKQLLALLEPIAILGIGAVIGFIMVAVMMAITSLNTAKL